MTRMRLIPISSVPAMSESEKLIDMGRVATNLLRQGTSMSDACALLRCTIEYCELALVFFTASDELRLRALVEDWSMSDIKRACFCEGSSFDDCKTLP